MFKWDALWGNNIRIAELNQGKVNVKQAKQYNSSPFLLVQSAQRQILLTTAKGLPKKQPADNGLEANKK